MSYDYRKEFAKFKTEWEKQEKIMRKEGMREETIAELYDFSYEQFKRDRNYALKICAYTQADDDENLTNENSRKRSMVLQPAEFESCFDLLEQIENPSLIQALKTLKTSDYKLLCLAVMQDLTEREIAYRYGQTQQNISRKIQRIKKNLKKFL